MNDDASRRKDDSAVVELRQYTLHPGRRDDLIELFDEKFVESQEAIGMRVLGQFRALGDPDRFVWLRGYGDRAKRAELLATYYTGPVWKANRERANATMIDSDNVLLLRPVDAHAGVPQEAERAPFGAPAPPAGRIVATIYLLTGKVDDDFVRFFEDRVRPLVTIAGAAPIARYRAEYAKNEYPRLPVREGENAFVWLARFPRAEDFAHHLEELGRSRTWTREVEPELARRLKAKVQHLQLEPTARSLLR